MGRAYSLSTFYYNGRLQPNVQSLRFADRLEGISGYAIITLFGRFAGSLEETREVYFELVRRAAPALLNHLGHNG